MNTIHKRPLVALVAALFIGGNANHAVAQAQPAQAEQQVPEVRVPVLDAPVTIDIPAQSLADALRLLGRQTPLQLVFTPQLVAGKNAPAVRGQMPPRQALDALLKGSALEYVQSESTVTLRRAAALAQADQELPEVTVPDVRVTAAQEKETLPKPYAGGQVARGGRVGVLGDRDFMDTPFATQSFTREFMDNQQSRTLVDVAEADPSIRSATSSAAPYVDWYYFRGFAAYPKDAASLNGLFGLTGWTPSLEYIERVEVLKGPSAFLAGVPGIVGGTMNFRLKRAGDAPLARLTGDYASDSILGGHIDVARRFGTDNAWGVRVNGAYRDGDTAIEDGRYRAHAAALALDYRGERFRASVDLIDEKRKNFGYSWYASLAPGVALPPPPDASRFIQPPWMTFWSENRLAMGRIEWDLTENWTATAAYGGATYGVAYTGFCFARILNPQGNVSCSAFPANSRDSYTGSGEIGIGGRFATGSIGHRLFAGLTNVESISRLEPLAGLGTFNYNIYNAFRPAQPPLPAFGSTRKSRETTTRGLYLGDTLSMLDERVQLTLGARHTSLQSKGFNVNTGAQTSGYDDSATTPSVALLVKPWQHFSLYGNYIEALERGGTAPATAANAGQVFAPLVSKQIEGGVKADFGKLGGTLSVFRIRKPNEFLNAATNTFTQNGLQENTGIELIGFGEPAHGLRLIAGLAWIDARQKQTAGGIFDGKKAAAVPHFDARIAGEWDIARLPGLALTGAMVHSSSAAFDNANTQRVPGWTRYDLGTRYTFAAGGKPVTARLSIENLANKDYWVAGFSGGVAIAAPRSVLISLTADF